MNPIKTLKKVAEAARLFKYAFGKYRFRIIATATLGFFGGLMGSLGTGSLIPLFSILTNQKSDDPITATIRNGFDFLNISFNPLALLLLIIFLFISKSAIIFTVTYLNSTLANKYQQDTRKKLLRDTLGANWLFLLNQKLGFVDRVILEDVPPASAILFDVSDSILKLSSIFTYALIAVNISSSITLITLLAGGAVFFAIKPIFYKIRKLSETISLTGKSAAHYIIESMLGIKTIKASAVENRVFEAGSVYFENLKKNQLKTIIYQGISNGLFEPLSIIFISGILLFYYQKPDFNIASFAVIFYMIQKIFTIIQSTQLKINNINANLPYLKIMLDYQRAIRNAQEPDTGNKSFSFKDRLTVKNVSFAYPGYKDSLSDITLEIKKGEMVGIIGPSGAGKTTLVDILLRLLEPQSGEINIDGINIKEISRHNWRQNIGYVSQDIFLFNDTIENNIRFYNESLSPEEIEVATKMANIYDFIKDLPDHFQTIIGERGVKLSGGQRQRIILARVLARKSSLIILDEATSSLDNESEALIQQTIKNIKNKVTLLVIAHRLSTITNSDRLLVIENGRIKESGAPAELIENKKSYFHKVSDIANN